MKRHTRAMRLLVALLCCLVGGGFASAQVTGELRLVSVQEILNAISNGAPIEHKGIQVTCGPDETLDLRLLFEAGSLEVGITVDIKIVDSEIDCLVTTGGTITHFQKTVNFTNTHFRQEVILANAIFDQTSNFNNASFHAGTNFDRSTFVGAAVFDGTKFGSGCAPEKSPLLQCTTTFWNTEFGDGTSFFEAEFAGNLQDLFRDTTFGGDTTFEETRFLTPTYFVNTTFPSGVDFTLAEFTDEARFEEVTFSKPALFREVVFRKRAAFLDVAAEDTVDFSQAEFVDSVQFVQPTFSKPVSFWRARFTSPSVFRSAAFGDTVNFSQAEFVGSVVFQDITFSSSAFFRGVLFRERSTFINSTSIDMVDFWQADFEGETLFQDITFSAPVFFRDTDFFNNSNFVRTTFDDTVNFSQAKFVGAVQFEEVAAVGSMLFHGTYFGGMFSFQGSVFDALDLTGISMVEKGQLFLFTGTYNRLVVSNNFNFDWLTIPTERNLQTEALNFYTTLETSTRQQELATVANEALFYKRELECQLAPRQIDTLVGCSLGALTGHLVRFANILFFSAITVVVFGAVLTLGNVRRKHQQSETVNLRFPYKGSTVGARGRHLVLVGTVDRGAVQDGANNRLGRILERIWEGFALSFMEFISLWPVKWEVKCTNRYVRDLVALLLTAEYLLGLYALVGLATSVPNTISGLGSLLAKLA